MPRTMPTPMAVNGEMVHLGGAYEEYLTDVEDAEVSRPRWPYVLLHVGVALLIGVDMRLVLLPQALLADAAKTDRTDFLVFFGVAKAIGNFVGGSLADSWGRKPTCLMGWLLGLPLVVTLFGAQAAKSPLLLDMSDLLLGAMQGMTWGLNIITLMDILGPEGRCLASALSNAAGYFGSAATAPAAAELVARAGDASSCVAVLCVGVSLGLALVALDTKTWHTHGVEDSAAPVRGAAGLRARLGCGSAVQVLCLLSGHIVNLATALIWGATVQWMKTEGDISIRGVGFMEAWFTGLKVLAMLGSGLLAYRVRPQEIAAVAVALMAAGLGWLAAQAASPPVSWPKLLCATGLLGLGAGGAYPALEAAVIKGTPEHRRASMYGAYRMWRDLGFASGGLLTRLFDAFASEVFAVFLCSAVTAVCFLGRAFCAGAAGRPERAPSAEPPGASELRAISS